MAEALERAASSMRSWRRPRISVRESREGAGLLALHGAERRGIEPERLEDGGRDLGGHDRGLGDDRDATRGPLVASKVAQNTSAARKRVVNGRVTAA